MTTLDAAERDAIRGIELAKQAMRRLADGRDGEVLGLVNAGTHTELAWATSYLLSALRESVRARCVSEEATRAAIHRAAADEMDVLMTRVGVALEQHQRGGRHG